MKKYDVVALGELLIDFTENGVSATEISASISQMFASKFNDDKKTLAFSDNVQDAAHRAGFFWQAFLPFCLEV